MIVDAEAALTAYLEDAVDALGATVRGRTPDSHEDPWVRLTLLDAPATDGGITDHHIAAYVQFDCYAGRTGGQAEANLLGRTVRDALRTIATADLDDAVASGARIDGHFRQPDTDFEPARERVVLTATVWLHS